MAFGCLTETELEQLVRSGEPVPAEVEQHLTECRKCQQALDALAARITPPGACPEALAEASSVHDVAVTLANRVSESHAPETDLPRTLGQFEILGLMGQGGMGIVYQARDLKLGREVALKVLHPHIAADPALRARLFTEARAAARIEHDNVVTIHSVEENGSSPFLVMQRIRGESLAQRVARSALSVSDTIRLGSELAAGLSAAHAEGVIHRDLKPANIFLDRQTGRALIGDFGLARVGDEPGQTKSGTVAGTPEFMSPEQARGEKVEATADLFSLGTVLYYALTGVSPFRAESVMGCLHRVCDAEPPEVSELRAEAPAWLSEAIGRLLRKSPADRFPSAEAVTATFRSLGNAAGPNDSAGGKRWPIIAAVATLIALAVLAWRFGRPDPTAVATVGAELADQARTLPAAPVKQPPGFGVAGSGRFDSLADAIESATSGAEIQVFGQGLLAVEPIVLRGKELTIRAAPGSHPRLVPTETPATGPFLRTDSYLEVVGLAIDWEVADVATETRKAVIFSSADRMSVSNCSFNVGTNTAAVEISGGEARVERCDFRGADGYGVRWTSDALSSLTVRECQFSNRAAILAHLYRKEFRISVGTLSLTRCQFGGGSVVQLVGNVGAQRRIAVRADGNVFFSRQLCMLGGQVAGRRFRRDPEQSLRKLLTWDRDRQNVYSASIIFLAFQGPQRIIPVGLAETFDDWIALWGFRDSGSQTQVTADALPAGVGPDLSTVGAGDAYDRWRAMQ